MTRKLEKDSMRIRIDNTQAKLFVERGWSPTMAHMSRVYGVHVLWVTERIAEGLMETMYEKTSLMLADPLTKVRDPQVYWERKIMTEVPTSIVAKA